MSPNPQRTAAVSDEFNSTGARLVTVDGRGLPLRLPRAGRSRGLREAPLLRASPRAAILHNNRLPPRACVATVPPP